MKVLLFGATGMVGQGVLRACLLDDDVTRVVSIGRGATGNEQPKLTEIVRADLFAYDDLAVELAGFDACLFCLGVSAAGMSEADYRRVTYDLTLAAARAVLKASPGVTFEYVSGAGTSNDGKGAMWARVKGETERALLAMPFKAAFMVRPAAVQPQHGIRSKTPLYRAFYTVLGPLFPVVKAAFPKYVTTTDELSKAMLAVAKRGASKKVLENEDIRALGA